MSENLVTVDVDALETVVEYAELEEDKYESSPPDAVETATQKLRTQIEQAESPTISVNARDVELVLTYVENRFELHKDGVADWIRAALEKVETE